MSLRFNSSQELINSLSLLIEKTKENRKQREDSLINKTDTTFKKGKVEAAYSTGRPRIIFQGETTASVKAYPYLESYVPKANDIVLLARVGNSYVILGKIK